MASIYKEFTVAVEADSVWAALRDFKGLREKLVPGFVTECRVEGSARVLTFFNGMVAREELVSIDDDVRRVSYTVVGGQATHHNASAQVFPDGAERARFVWITDVLPDEFAAPIEAMMDRGVAVMKATLESAG